MTRAWFCTPGLALTVLQALGSDLRTHNMPKSPSFSIKRDHGGSSAPLPVCFLPIEIWGCKDLSTQLRHC